MRTITGQELKEILNKHQKWLDDEDGGECANLSYYDLSYCNLRGVYLDDASLRGSSLNFASLNFASLDGADLSYCDLRGASLNYVSLDGAVLYGVKNMPFIPLACPSDGSFIGWKRVKKYIVKLEIPAKAKRSSATTSKCRCEYAEVLAIENNDGTTADVQSVTNDRGTTYKVGETVYPDSYDENRWNECSHGIHFFANRQEAVNYI